MEILVPYGIKSLLIQYPLIPQAIGLSIKLSLKTILFRCKDTEFC